MGLFGNKKKSTPLDEQLAPASAASSATSATSSAANSNASPIVQPPAFDPADEVAPGGCGGWFSSLFGRSSAPLLKGQNSASEEDPQARYRLAKK